MKLTKPRTIAEAAKTFTKEADHIIQYQANEAKKALAETTRLAKLQDVQNKLRTVAEAEKTKAEKVKKNILELFNVGG